MAYEHSGTTITILEMGTTLVVENHHLGNNKLLKKEQSATKAGLFTKINFVQFTSQRN